MDEVTSGTTATTETPSTAAPAVTESVSSTPTAPAERPKTWDDAYAQVDAQFQTALGTEEPAQDGDAPTTAEPPKPPEPSDAQKGPIPFEAHKKALENARTKAAEDVRAEIQQKHGQAIQTIEALHGDMQSGNIEGWAQLTQEYIQHPVLGQQMRSFFGRMLGAKGQTPQPQQQPQSQPTEDPEPQRYVEHNGERYFDPAKDAEWQAWRERQLTRKFEDQFKPVTEFVRDLNQAKALQQQRQQVERQIDQRLAFLREQPGFKDHEPAIKVRQAELVQTKGLDPWSATFAAYAEIVPKALQAQSTNDLTAAAVAKAAGRTDNPAASAPAPPRRPRSWDEAYAQQGLV